MPSKIIFKKTSPERQSAYKIVRDKVERGIPLHGEELDLFVSGGKDIETQYELPEKKRILKRLSEIDTTGE